MMRPAIRRWHQRLLAGAGATVVLSVLPVASTPQPAPARHERLELRFERLVGRWLSAPVASSRDFGLVGVAWRRGDAAIDVGTPFAASIRTSQDARRWTRWQELEIQDNGPDRGSPEDAGIVATEPVWVGRARIAQIRWATGRPPASAALHVIDGGSDPAQPRASALAATSQPSIISRAQWGADESIRRCCARYAPSVDFAVVHHTVSANNYRQDEAAKIVRSIYEYHVKTNGWGDIGYQFLIDRFGRVFEGRGGGIREAVIGSHSEGFNTRSTGVALIGSFQSQPAPAAAMTSLRNLLAWKLDVHHVDPRSSTTVVSGGSKRYAAGKSVKVNAIATHRDLQVTTCPGDPVISAIPKLRTDVYATGLPKIFRPRLSPGVFTPNGDGRSDTLRTTAAISDGASWQVRVRNAGNAVLRSWSGTGGSLDVRWNGLDANGQQAPHGRYKVSITATKSGKSATPIEIVARLYRDPWGAWTRATALESSTGPRVAGPSGTFHLLARDSGGALRHWRWSGGVWTAGDRLGSAAFADGRFGLVAGRNGELHAIVRGQNSNFYHGRLLRDGSFTGWARIGSASSRGNDVAVALDRTGALHAVVVGMNGNLYANRYNGSWSTWKRVGRAEDKGTQPVLATGRGGDVIAVMVAPSATIFANKIDPGHGWNSAWKSVGRSPGSGTEPTVASVDEGFIVLVRGRGSPTIWQSTGTIGHWGGWSRVGSASDTGYEPAAINVLGDIVLVVRGRSSGRLYANVRAPDGGWRGWDEAGDSLQQGARPTLTTTNGEVMIAAEVPGSAPATVLGRPPLRPS
jgi:hypothetical protein